MKKNALYRQREREVACTMARLNDQIAVGLIPGAGHTAELQQPVLYNLMVTTFWGQVDPPPPISP